MFKSKTSSSRRAHKQFDVTRFDKATSDGLWSLAPMETWWRDRQVMLEAHGYLLRPRFRPGWKASWEGTNLVPDYCEDSISISHSEVIDARRLSDQSQVIIKRVPANTEEIAILQSLQTPESTIDPANHCVPLLDVFEDDSEHEYKFIVMPLLRKFNEPSFLTVGEMLDFMRQVLEAMGIVFIHSRNVAHRDCSSGNLMMDGTLLAPRGFHPSRQHLDPSGARPAKFLTRSDVSGIKYYFIDFGLSVRFVDPTEPHLALGMNGQDRVVPELSNIVPYDPFAVDIFIIGNLFKISLILYANLECLNPLVRRMTHEDPKSRPSASEALEQFGILTAEKKGWSSRWRLQPESESRSRGVYNDVCAYAREGLYIARASKDTILSSLNLTRSKKTTRPSAASSS